MRLIDTTEWILFATERASRNSFGQTKEAQARLEAICTTSDVQDLIHMCDTGTVDEQVAAAWIIHRVAAEDEDDPSRLRSALGPDGLADCVRAIRGVQHRAELRSRVWTLAGICLYSLGDGTHKEEDLRLRGMSATQFEELRQKATKEEGLRRFSRQPPVAEAVDALLLIHSPAQPSPGLRDDLVRLAQEWRESRVRATLSALYERYIGCLPDHVVPLTRIVELLGPPDHWSGDHKVYYGTTPDSGLVLHADANGLLTGRKLN